MSMLMIAIIGAVISGILMAVAHGKAKQGIGWGQPVEVACGVLAIIFGFWAVWENIMGVPEAQQTAEKWQVVRGTGAAEYIKQKCAGKKILIIKNYKVEGYPDRQYDALAKGLEGVDFQTYELPKPKEVSGPDADRSMMFDGGVWTAAVKKEAQKEADEFNAAITAAHDPASYDVVVFLASVYDWMIFDKPLKAIKAFEKKNFIFLYSIDPKRMAVKNSPIIGLLSDKSLTNPDDYDKAPTGDQNADFNFRFETKDGPAK